MRTVLVLAAALLVGAPTNAAAAAATEAARVHGAPAAKPPAAPPPGKVLIEGVKAKHSGCKTAIVKISEDNEAFTVLYSDYLVAAGPGTKPADAKRNCRLTVRMSVPAGYTYAVVSVDHRGFAALAPGAKGVMATGFHLQGSPPAATVEHPLPGPVEDNWQRTVEWPAPVWSKCGKERKFDITTELRVDAGSSDKAETNQIIMDSTDAEIGSHYRLAWKTCTG